LISRLKILILVNWKEEGKWFFLRSLQNRVARASVLQPLSFPRAINGKLTYLSNYLSEFYVPILALIQRNPFDIIVSWQMRIGICYGIVKRLCHPHKPPLHIIQDFHIDLTQTHRLYRLQIALLKLAIPGIDYFCCTSTEEEAIYHRMFNIPRSRISFLPLAQSPDDFEESSYPEQDYIFSYGRSDRDFDTLIRSVSVLKLKTYILSQKYKPRVPVPENVCLIRDYVSSKEMAKWIASSRIVVLPLKDYRVSAGQISMLEVMSLGKPLIITSNMATREYAIHQQTALFFEAGNDKELIDHIGNLWNNHDIAKQMGHQARLANRALNDKLMTVFSGLLERCTMDIQKGVC